MSKKARPFLHIYIKKYGMPPTDRAGHLRAKRVKTCDCPHRPKTVSDMDYHDSIFHKGATQ